MFDSLKKIGDQNCWLSVCSPLKPQPNPHPLNLCGYVWLWHSVLQAKTAQKKGRLHGRKSLNVLLVAKTVEQSDSSSDMELGRTCTQGPGTSTHPPKWEGFGRLRSSRFERPFFSVVYFNRGTPPTKNRNGEKGRPRNESCSTHGHMAWGCWL